LGEWFSEPEPNLIESTAGFSVQVLGRTGMRYREEGRSVSLDSELMNEPMAMLAYAGSIKKWDAPHEADQVNDSDRRRIVQNITRAFEAMGYKITFV
jgi:hypothetical protein